MKRPLSWIYSLFLIIFFLAPGFMPEEYKGMVSEFKARVDTLAKLPDVASKAEIFNYSVDEINEGLQNARQKIGLDPLEVDAKICQSGQSVFEKYESQGALAKDDLEVFCPKCGNKAYLTVEGNYRLPGQVSWMEKAEATALLEQEYTHLCTFTSQNRALILLGSRVTGTPSTTTKAGKAPQGKDFTEEQLWQAFVDYRHAHAKPDLLKSESLCTYARKRVAEHVSMFDTKPKEQYKNPDKYPLDAHEGFERDGNSGYLFEVTEFNVVAENLAYWPSAEYAHQVIEWGWDTSTEGHREAQLSEEYSHACLSGSKGFTVAIFARN